MPSIKNSVSRGSSLFKPKSIENSNTLLKLFCCLVIIVLICIIIGHYAFKNGMLTCDHYVFNTYLYIILAIMLMFLIVLINDQFGIFNTLLEKMFGSGLLIAILSIVLILVLLFILVNQLRTIDPNKLLASNGIWLLIITIIGILMIPTIMLGRMTDVVGLAGILTVVIVIVVGLLGYYMGDKIVTFDWDYYLRFALIGLVIVSFLGIFFIKDANTMLTFLYVISIISLIIFVLLLLSNHKKLRENSEKCIDGKVVPNYPYESWNLVIKIVNVFADLIRILAIRKSRGFRR
jgi:FtsH-binding integral membrane protein